MSIPPTLTLPRHRRSSVEGEGGTVVGLPCTVRSTPSDYVHPILINPPLPLTLQHGSRFGVWNRFPFKVILHYSLRRTVLHNNIEGEVKPPSLRVNGSFMSVNFRRLTCAST